MRDTTVASTVITTLKIVRVEAEYQKVHILGRHSHVDPKITGLDNLLLALAIFTNDYPIQLTRSTISQR